MRNNEPNAFYLFSIFLGIYDAWHPLLLSSQTHSAETSSLYRTIGHLKPNLGYIFVSSHSYGTHMLCSVCSLCRQYVGKICVWLHVLLGMFC